MLNLIQDLFVESKTWEFEPRWGEMDANSHINNVNYLRYYEEARARFFQSFLISPELRHRIGLAPVIHRTEVDFCFPLIYPCRAKVQTSIKPKGAIRMHIHQQIDLIEPAKVASKALTSALFLDLKTNKPVAIKKAMARFQRALSEDQES